MSTEVMVAVIGNKSRVVLVKDAKIIETEPLQDNEILVPLGDYNNFIKPVWDGTQWIESATQEEIDEYKNITSLPSTDERLEALELAMLNIVLGGAV